ncbi:MAG: membrane dipeptidase [Rhizobiaceae bacterium]
MRLFVSFLGASSFLLAIASAFAQTTISEGQAMNLHDRLLTIDSHVDIGTGYGTARLNPAVLNDAQVNLPSMRSGGLDAAFFIVFTPQGETTSEGYARAKKFAEEKYRGISLMLNANGDTIGLATTADEVEALKAQGKLIALIGIENSFPLGSTEEEVAQAVKLWQTRGARYASITHFGHNQFGGSSNPSSRRNDGEDPGLSSLGRYLISALNDHGIMVDISHVGPRTSADAIKLSRAPVIASHSTVKSVYNNARGLTDEQLMAIRDSGGVAQITAYRSYLARIDPRIVSAMGALRKRLKLTSFAAFNSAAPEIVAEYRRERGRIRSEFDDVSLTQFLDHVDHAIKTVGINHVGLSGDFDGGGGVEGWDGASDSPNVTKQLLERGYSEEDLAKLWGGNLLRVMRDVESAAKN